MLGFIVVFEYIWVAIEPIICVKGIDEYVFYFAIAVETAIDTISSII